MAIFLVIIFIIPSDNKASLYQVVWWNNMLLLVPNCYDVVAMVTTSYGCAIVMSYTEIKKAMSQWLLTFNLCVSVTWPLTCAFHIPCTHTPLKSLICTGACVIKCETYSCWVSFFPFEPLFLGHVCEFSPRTPHPYPFASFIFISADPWEKTGSAFCLYISDK